ncbi:Ig-like domain-containing protein [Paenibacillus koleovorans]|uniref:Ig-like domain-containing protein n=1 Tax=Paenibacillus koleovorans TaxID=121608 RepID=UPI0013E290D6|nr:Ig-like domain-containing protein [Paenibacillus koleovorans]
MKKAGGLLLGMLVLIALFCLGSAAMASGDPQMIIPTAAGAATGSQFFPLENAFDSTDPGVDGTGTPTGGAGANNGPAYSTSRVGYIDFGPNWANVRITATWTKYRASSTGNMTPYTELWWDDDIDMTNDGTTETRINFNSVQSLPNTGSTTPWIRDSDVSSSPVAPAGRYLLLRSPANMTNRASEYGIVGYIHEESIQVIRPASAGQATGSSFFPMNNAFDGQPTLDALTGVPTGGATAADAPAYGNRVGYIDFGPDWSKVRITSTWTRYRASSGGNQTPYASLWWDDDIDSTNDSGLTETRINFNSAQNLSTGSTTPWILDSDVSSSPVAPQARYLMARSPLTMTNRASEYAFVGWIDENGNGVQDAPNRAVSAINVTSAGGATSMLTSTTLQMSAAVLPFDATNNNVTWSVVNGTGSATINSSGLLTAVADGTVTVKATAQDGSGVFGSLVIDISAYSQLILPVQGAGSIYYIDLQASFPNVDWNTLERLYIPAGTYQFIKLGNLPIRTAANPLIISNYGGQVKVTGTHSYTLSIEGGKHWILTGKYDNTLKTGHVNFQGHQNGNYSTSTGNYGIEVGRNTSNGIGVGKKATNFELSFIEVAHAGFAGLLIKTDNDPTAVMDGVKIHDLYIHDSESEGMYIGNTSSNLDTQHIFTNLEIYNNRVLRSGTEGIQLSNMGDGIKVHNNVVVMNALDWKDPFQLWQDGCFQYSQRTGSAEIYNNVFIGSASSLFSVRISAGAGETPNSGDEVYFHDNYFSHSRDILAYIHNTPSNYLTKFRFEDNMIRQLNYQYDELPGTHVNANKMFYVSDNTNNPMIFKNNTRDGSQVFIDTIGGNNGTSGNITATGNTTNTSLAPIVFEDVTFPSTFDWSLVERWDDTSSLYGGSIYFDYGDYVYYFPTGALYKNIEAGSHTGKNPTTNPSTWSLQTPMKEDFRLDSTSPYQGIGLSQ